MRGFLLRVWNGFLEELPKWVIGALLTSGVLVVLLNGGADWTAREWACVQRSMCEVSGPSLGAAILALLVFVGLLVWLIPFYWHHRKRKFKPFDVIDEKLKLKWSMQKDPDSWLNKGYSEMAGPNAIDTGVLIGPVHDIPTCNDVVPTRGANTFGDLELERRCLGCGDLLFSNADPHTPLVRALRWSVFRELERLDRLKPLAKRMRRRRRIVLERPNYWQNHHAPDSPKDPGPDTDGGPVAPRGGRGFSINIAL